MPDYEFFLGLAVLLLGVATVIGVTAFAIRFALAPVIRDIAKELKPSEPRDDPRMERLERVLVDLDRRVGELADARDFDRALGKGSEERERSGPGGDAGGETAG